MYFYLKTKNFILLLVFLLSSNFVHSAVDVTSHMIIHETVFMDASPRYINFGTLTASDFNQGYIESIQATTITVKSNSNWQLRMRPLQNNMGQSTNYVKPLMDFQWRLAGQYYLPMIPAEQSIFIGEPTANTQIGLDYKILTSWEEPPGSYGLTITFMLSTAV